MAGKELIIDDDFCRAMADYFVKQGEHLDQVISEYNSILETIRENGIKEGDVARALSAYISYSKKLSKQFGNISSIAKTHVNNFLTRVDSADQYLF